MFSMFILYKFFLLIIQGNIQSLTATELDGYKAEAWLLSPPCQPYTRQGQNSSLHILLVLPILYILLIGENYVYQGSKSNLVMPEHLRFSNFLNLCHYFHNLLFCYLWKMSLDLRSVHETSAYHTNKIVLLEFEACLFIYLLLFGWLQTSDTHAKMIEILGKSEYVTQEFILSPLQFGVPYSRPRYFCLVASSILLGSFSCLFYLSLSFFHNFYIHI